MTCDGSAQVRKRVSTFEDFPSYPNCSGLFWLGSRRDNFPKRSKFLRILSLWGCSNPPLTFAIRCGISRRLPTESLELH